MTSLTHLLSENLQCPICLSPLSDPRKLSCSHTFCIPCLSLLPSAQTDVDTLTSQSASSSENSTNTLICPICRSSTPLSGDDASKLPTNYPIKSQVSDVITSRQECDNCETKAKAEHFCCECEQNMCESCRTVHDGWKLNTNHRVDSVSDIQQGRVVLPKKSFCKEHKTGEGKHECSDVCITCKKVICPICKVLRHSNADHEVKSVVEYQTASQNEAKNLQTRGKEKSSSIKKHIDFVQTVNAKIAKNIDKLESDIENYYQQIIERLNKRKSSLIQRLAKEKVTLCEELQTMKRGDEFTTNKLENACMLMERNLMVSLNRDSIAIRDSICNELENVLSQDSPNYDKASDISIRSEQLEYVKNEKANVQYMWKRKADIALSTVNTMCGMVATPDGRMAVGCFYGERGIEIYSADGQLQQTVLDGKRANALGFLSDGRCVIRDANNNNAVSMYTPEWEKLDVGFETLSFNDGGLGGLTVDSDDHIYASYSKAKKIQVFTQSGGKPVREIQCDGYVPSRIFAMKFREMLIVNDGTNAARVIDGKSGYTYKTITKDTGIYVHPALHVDDTILIATVNKDCDRVNIEHYTSELKHVSTLVTDHVIEKTDRELFYLQEFSSGEIAFCTTDRLYIFVKSVTMPGE